MVHNGCEKENSDGGEMTRDVCADPIKELERRRKMSEARKGEKNPMFGKHHTEKSRRKMSELRKGKIVSEETRRKMSEAHKKPQRMSNP
jgi:hypothetical protein